MAKISLYRSMHQLRGGGLNKHLNVPKDDDLPEDKLADQDDDNDHVKSMKNFARMRSEKK